MHDLVGLWAMGRCPPIVSTSVSTPRVAVGQVQLGRPESSRNEPALARTAATPIVRKRKRRHLSNAAATFTRNHACELHAARFVPYGEVIAVKFSMQKLNGVAAIVPVTTCH